MQNLRVVLFAPISLCLGLTGCGALLDPEAKFQGAIQIIETKKKFVKVDLPAILDPLRLGQIAVMKAEEDAASIRKSPEPELPSGISKENENVPVNEQNSLEDVQAREKETTFEFTDGIENAFLGFYSSDYDNNTRVLRRNRVQDRLIAASNETCKDFKEKLQLLQAEGNFVFGAITTALAGAGAIVTGATGARILAGSAGVTSGIGAEFNDAFFASLAVEVLTKAFEARRKDILMEIGKHRMVPKSGIEVYPVERAVADALNYHAACNLISGLEEASERVTLSSNIGLKQLNKMLEGSGMEQRFKLQVEDATLAPAPAPGPAPAPTGPVTAPEVLTPPSTSDTQ